MPSSASQVLVTTVCPLLGAIISNCMWLAPWKLVMKARENRHLGSINPLPFAVTFLNNIGWVTYACLLGDFYIFFSSVFGILFALFYTITCLTIMAKEAFEDEFTPQYVQVEGLLLFALFFWSLMGIIQTVIFTQLDDPKLEATHMIGYLCAFFNICYYAAPLSSMAHVIATKDASSLYLPNILVNSLNATLWLCYGAFGVNNPVVWGPSCIGLTLSLIQVALVFIYTKGFFMHAVSGENTQQSILVKSRVLGDKTISFVLAEHSDNASVGAGEDFDLDPEEERVRTMRSSSFVSNSGSRKYLRPIRYSIDEGSTPSASRSGKIRTASFSKSPGKSPSKSGKRVRYSIDESDGVGNPMLKDDSL